MAIIPFNNRKKRQFNEMREALRVIAEDYYSINALRAAAEQAYENMRNDAKNAIRNVRPFKE